MISLLPSSNPISIGAMLGTDFNQSLLSNQKDKIQTGDLLERLKNSGYENIIGIVPPGIDLVNDADVLTNSIIKKAYVYSVEKDLPFLLDTSEASTLGNKYLLIEADIYTPSSHLEDAVLQLQLKGYVPVLLQAERYENLQDNYRNIQRLQDRGCLLQADILSLTGAVGAAAKRLAKRLIYGGFASFIGSGMTTPDEHRRFQPLLHSRKLARLLRSANVKNRELIF